MNNNNKFQEMGNYLIQMGLYLSTVNINEFEERTQIKENITSFLMQSYMFLKTYNDKQELEETIKKDKFEENDNYYLSRKELLKAYHPLFTEYGLSQSIHTKGLPYIKRGSKYFFKKSEIDLWLKENQGNCGNKLIRYV